MSNEQQKAAAPAPMTPQRLDEIRAYPCRCSCGEMKFEVLAELDRVLTPPSDSDTALALTHLWSGRAFNRGDEYNHVVDMIGRLFAYGEKATQEAFDLARQKERLEQQLEAVQREIRVMIAQIKAREGER